MPNRLLDLTENGTDYRIILEPANMAHPAYSVVALFLKTKPEYTKLWEHKALADESDDKLMQKAQVIARGHSVTGKI